MNRAGIQLFFAFTVLLKVVCSVVTLEDIPPNECAIKAREMKDNTRLTCSAVKANALDKTKVTKTYPRGRSKRTMGIQTILSKWSFQ